MIIVYLFKPLVDRLERYKVPRVAGGCLAYLLFGAVLVLIGVLIVPVMSNQAVELVDRVPKAIDSASDTVSDLAVRLNLPASFQGVESLSDGLRDWFCRSGQPGGPSWKGSAGSARLPGEFSK